jgi:hypothetical protein
MRRRESFPAPEGADKTNSKPRLDEHIASEGASDSANSNCTTQNEELAKTDGNRLNWQTLFRGTGRFILAFG